MRSIQSISARVTKWVGLVLVLLFTGALTAFVVEDTSRDRAQAQTKLESTIFSFSGQEFVRTSTTLVTEAGKSAVGTKLEHDSPAYKALIKKRSYTGDATVFGHKYHAYYAPLTADDGHLTGALFVAVAE